MPLASPTSHYSELKEQKREIGEKRRGKIKLWFLQSRSVYTSHGHLKSWLPKMRNRVCSVYLLSPQPNCKINNWSLFPDNYTPECKGGSTEPVGKIYRKSKSKFSGKVHPSFPPRNKNCSSNNLFDKFIIQAKKKE